MPLSVFGDLIIKSGVTFTITSEVFFSEKSRIIVEESAKLIVDGGRLSNGCGSSWKGIKVYGGNSDFDVKFINGAIVENTSNAAVSMFAPENWPTITQWGNGILYAENTTFNNTQRIAEFMSWSPLPNPSYVKNCVQNGGKWSITNWNCQGIEIINNVFNDISAHCVVSSTGSFTIVGNEFNSMETDILFNNVSAGIHTRVEDNQFNGAETGYNARGTTFAQNEIWNNNFETGLNDVMNDGHNQYDLYANNITADFGSVSINNGAGIADVHQNDFTGNIVGTLPIGNNDDYNFFKNCYATTFRDNHIVGQVSPIIHSSGSAANNCFTHSGGQNSGISDIDGSPLPFTYLEPKDEVIDCRDAIIAHPNVNRSEFGKPDQPECGAKITKIERSNFWPKRSDKNAVSNAYNWLITEYEKIDKISNLSEKQKKEYEHIYSRGIRRVRGYLFEIYAQEGNYDQARRLYTKDNHEDANVYILSSYILENDLNSAKSYLKSIPVRSKEMSDFVTIQNINLERLPFGPFYKTSSDEINSVKNIALKSHPYAAYAKALYFSLTGEVISSEIPDIRASAQTQKRTSNTESSNTELRVYPNPFSENLYVEISGFEVVNVEITDIFGRSVFSKNTDQPVLNIPTDTWSNQGFYFITIRNKGEVVFTDKLFLAH